MVLRLIVPSFSCKRMANLKVKGRRPASQDVKGRNSIFHRPSVGKVRIWPFIRRRISELIKRKEVASNEPSTNGPFNIRFLRKRLLVKDMTPMPSSSFFIRFLNYNFNRAINWYLYRRVLRIINVISFLVRVFRNKICNYDRGSSNVNLTLPSQACRINWAWAEFSISEQVLLTGRKRSSTVFTILIHM